MDRLPDEITLRIASFIATSEWQLLELERVSRKLRCVIQDQTLWYQLFQQNFKNWGRHIPYACRQPLVDWRAFVIHLAKQKLRSRSLTFDFVRAESSLDPFTNRKRKIHESTLPSYKNLSRHQELDSIDTCDSNSTSTISSPASDSLDTMMDTISPFMDLTPHGPSSSIPVPETSFARESQLRHLLTRSSSTSFRIQDPLVVDIDGATQIGMVATGKHRKAAGMRNNDYNDIDSYSTRSEHKILFWRYPSWQLVRELNINLSSPGITCQVVGLQTVRIKKHPLVSDADHVGQSYQSIRLFALAIGQSIHLQGDGHPDFDDFDDNDGFDENNDDRVDLWQTVLVYRLFDNGDTQCLASVPLDGQFMGRDVFFFSDYSWTFGDTDGRNTTTAAATKHDGDGSTNNTKQRSVRDWLQMVAPEHTEYDPHFTLFMLVIGPTSDTNGCGKLIQFDLEGDLDILDPVLMPVTWNPTLRCIVPTRIGATPFYVYQHYHWKQKRQQQQRSFFPSRSHPQQQQNQYSRENRKAAPNETNTNIISYIPPVPAKIIYTVYLGSHVSCMTLFKNPTCLSHLMCTGSYDNNELSVYDWRFGLKVGSLPWKSNLQQQSSASQQQQPQRHRNNQHTLRRRQHRQHQILDQLITRNQLRNIEQLTGQMIPLAQLQQQLDGSDDDDEDDDDDDDIDMDLQHEVFPWGLESTMILPPSWDHRALSNEEWAHRGLRLIAVGDNRLNRLEIKVWDISFLLMQAWDPLQQQHHSDYMDGGNDDDNDTTMVDAATAANDMEDWEKTTEWTKLFPWWRRSSRQFRYLGLRTTYERVQWDEQHYGISSVPIEIRQRLKRDPEPQQLVKRITWPLSPPTNHSTMLLAHAFDKPTTPTTTTAAAGANFGGGLGSASSSSSSMTVKYTAYNVLGTSLFLLTEDGKVTVMDIETGQVTGTIDNVAATAAARMDPCLSSFGRVHGIDVNVLSGHEVVVTSREGLLRSILS